ncbi:MAG: EAL domain-containing protein [Sphingomonas sp.]|uniref:putative bifunctional diguanylate cyclase/phosphodiesterase n=1 Tax=Sphingomonas sp. TaxID=28214 RepID=UPI0017C92F69|nr:EAL domain-containing protein [Sphingomonas sp.]MBA3667529.1 EAL domain-containing protein [Sphingomonas sp.]
MSVAPLPDRISRAVRQAQIDAFVRLVPATVAVQVLTAAVMVVGLRGAIDNFQLGLWFGAALLLCFMRGVRAVRLRIDPDYAQRHPARLETICAVVALLAALWLVPPLAWFDAAGHPEQIFMCVTIAALLSAGSMTLISLPQAALLYIGILSIGCASLALKFDNRSVFGLVLVYAGVLVINVLSTARQFIAHTRDRIELREQGEIIQLLREFEASGSGGLWELDSERRFVKISAELLQAIGFDEDRLMGSHYSRLLDPDGQIAALSTGMRQLFEDLEGGEPFRDRAIPSANRERWWSLSGKPIRDEHGNLVGWRGVASDITDSRLSGDDAVRAARTDPLTGLANRLLVRELLEEAVLRQWEGQGACALLLVDLDRFKLVNDTLGHAIGDQLLIEIGRRLERAVAPDGRVGRIGGDEFAIVWNGSADRAELSRVAERVIAEVSKSVSIGAATLHVGATVGIAVGPVDGDREEQLMSSADLALYRAKEAGRGGYAFYESYMFDEAEDHRLLEQDVREALNGDGLTLAYQPIVDAETGEVLGREALLRWRHPRRGDIPPDQFVPIVEDTGLIHQIGDWVIREACAEAVTWDRPLRVAVNISAAQLSGAGLAKTVLGALATTRLEPSRLELEVTESVFLGDDAATLASLERLRALGVRLVLDDFGKGYSSFGYLSRAQFSKIKIDQSFVRGAAEGATDCVAIVHAILALARGLGVETTAEGVETEVQAEAMRALGCNQLQGFYFGRPVAAAELLAEVDAPHERRSA